MYVVIRRSLEVPEPYLNFSVRRMPRQHVDLDMGDVSGVWLETLVVESLIWQGWFSKVMCSGAVQWTIRDAVYI